MENNFILSFWDKRIDRCRKSLEKNGFEVFCVSTPSDACKKAMEIVETAQPSLISYGDSMTMRETGILEMVSSDNRWEFIDGFDHSMSRDKRLDLRRKALGADLFMTGVNAVTEDGKLLWLDMIGNRIAPICFGPSTVILFVGRNKIVENSLNAKDRIKEIAAPMNAIRHEGMKTPCMTTGKCIDCASEDRICNAWLEVVKCFPKKRIKIILVNTESGL